MKPITIIGGGLAGLTLGILLRREKCPVTVHEAGSYPRHKVCGEFISGHGVSLLKDWGLLEGLEKRGAQWAESARFCSGRTETARLTLPYPALTISRYQMDAFLAETFCREGGVLKEQSRWKGDYLAPGMVRATGHRIGGRQKKWQWVGLKMHARNVSLDTDLEMHMVGGAYVGLCRVDLDQVNVCGLIRRRRQDRWSREELPRLLGGTAGTLLHQRLKSADWQEESFCATAGLDLQPHRSVAEGPCRIGDAMTMIAPLTGKGMSMALETAHLARPYLAEFSRGVSSWTEARQRMALELNRRFSRRLGYGYWLNKMAFFPGAPTLLGAVMARSDRAWNFLFQAVHG